MYETLTNIYNTINPHANLLFLLCKWFFIISCAYITIKKREHILKNNVINISLKVFNFLSLIFILYYLIVYVFLLNLFELKIYQGFIGCILDFATIISISGWIMLIILSIDIVIKLIKENYPDKIQKIKIIPKNKYFVFAFINALCFIFAKQVFEIIFILYF